MSDSYAAKLGRIADEMDARGDGVEGWEDSDLHRWAEGIRRVLGDRAEERGRWVAHINSCEKTIRGHKSTERWLKGWLAEAHREAEHLRNELARLKGQTHGYPTEDELSPEMRARLMPEGMSWPRFEDGEPVRLEDDVQLGNDWRVSGCVGGISFDADFDAPVEISFYNACTQSYAYGERVKRPEPPATASQECRDSNARDSWERIEDDATQEASAYCYHHGLGVARGSDPCEFEEACRLDLLRRARALAEGPDVVRPGEVV